MAHSWILPFFVISQLAGRLLAKRVVETEPGQKKNKEVRPSGSSLNWEVQKDEGAASSLLEPEAITHSYRVVVPPGLESFSKPSQHLEFWELQRMSDSSSLLETYDVNDEVLKVTDKKVGAEVLQVGYNASCQVEPSCKFYTKDSRAVDLGKGCSSNPWPNGVCSRGVPLGMSLAPETNEIIILCCLVRKKLTADESTKHPHHKSEANVPVIKHDYTPQFLRTLHEEPKQGRAGAKVTRDYTLLIDRSGSMDKRDKVGVPRDVAAFLGTSPGKHSMSRWQQVEGVLGLLAPYVSKKDPDGVSVMFFSDQVDHFKNVSTAKKVQNLFKHYKPKGHTYLAPALKKAIKPETVGRAETIFVLTDGKANDPEEVKKVIIEATHKMSDSKTVTVSFIQVACDSDSQEYLRHLDNELKEAKFDIVDTLTKDEMDGKSFLEIIEQSLQG